jgi:hypothetical protein
VEVLKSWQYFDDLRKLGEDQKPAEVESQKVAVQDVQP